MEKQKYLFDVSERYGGNEFGQREFLFDSFKLLLEDEDFFNEAVKLLNPNLYQDFFRELAGCILDAYSISNVKPSIGVVRDIVWHKYGNGHKPNYDSLGSYDRWELENIIAIEIDAFLEQINNRVLDNARIQEVKATFKYYHLFVYYVGIGNFIMDSARDGFCTPKALINKIEGCFDKVDTLYEAYTTFKENYENKENNTDNEWC